jgi:hypothetical protein
MLLEVTPKGLHVSLPDGLRGTVAADEVSGAHVQCNIKE